MNRPPVALFVIAADANIYIAIEISNETKVYWPTTDLTIFNVGLTCLGLINQHLEVLTAVRTFDIFLE
jgi:hypothetical protein